MSHNTEKSEFNNPVIQWIDDRLPIFTMLDKEYSKFPTPRNFNYLWNFGAIATVILVVMIATGFTLSMYYTANTDLAFASVERIMRDVNYGWLIRYIHANGASMFFIAVYIHMFRGLYYGSYKAPREMLWMFGVLLFLLMMAAAFTGYALVWGQMSLWGVNVITNMFSAIPIVGEHIVTWLWGGFSVGNPTLNRFFSFHFLLPFVIVAVVFFHVLALHITGSNNPSGIEPKTEKDTVPFHPYYTGKDTFGIAMFMILFAVFVFYFPNVLGHPDNYIEANPLVTPPHIVPEWYFLPFYAILRAIPDKLGGVTMMFAAVSILFVVPWLDRQKAIRSGRYRPLFKVFFALFVFTCMLLTYCGGKPAEGHYITLARLGTAYYFAFFLVVLPLLPLIEKVPANMPKSIAESIGKAAIILALATSSLVISQTANASSEHQLEPPEQEWAHQGILGDYDHEATQRGYRIYQEICASCHSLNYLSYRNLEQIGFTEGQVTTLAAAHTVTDGPDEFGDMFERPALPQDRFVAPYSNEAFARAANGGALPPDLSLVTKAREGGEDYIYALLTGFIEPSATNEGEWVYSHNKEEIVPHEMVPAICIEGIPVGQYCNLYFRGNLIAMPPPITENSLASFEDVFHEDYEQAMTPETLSFDVTNFLTWAAEPHQGDRKRLGLRVIIFLMVFAAISYAAKRRTWKKLH